MYELIAVRTMPSDDLSHEHIDIVGYHSPHIDSGEAIFIPPARVVARTALGESFGVKADGEGEPTPVKAGTCGTCGFEPYLDPQDAILALPRK